MPEEKVDPARYNTRLDNKYGYLTVVDIPKEVSEHAPWFNQTLTQVNDSVVRLGILEGEYHWHKHDAEDEREGAGAAGGGLVRAARAPRMGGGGGVSPGVGRDVHRAPRNPPCPMR